MFMFFRKTFLSNFRKTSQMFVLELTQQIGHKMLLHLSWKNHLNYFIPQSFNRTEFII